MINLMNCPKLIVFDLNKTLIEENSWLDLNLAMGITQEEDDELVRLAAAGKIDDAEGQRRLLAIYKERGEPTRQNIMNVIGKYRYKTGAEDTIRELGRRGFELALISGSMDILVEKVASELGIPYYAANNRFIFDEHDILQAIETEDNDDEYKLHQLRMLTERLGISVLNCMAIGDGANDVRLFEETKWGVTFEDSDVAHKARYTINGLSDLLQLLELR